MGSALPLPLLRLAFVVSVTTAASTRTPAATLATPAASCVSYSGQLVKGFTPRLALPTNYGGGASLGGNFYGAVRI
jgi:hypothetical protein